MDMQAIARQLLEAEKTATPISPLSQTTPELTVADAYAIQQALISLRKAAGERIIGMKIGLTSRAMQTSLGIDTPDYGHLTDTMVLQEGQDCPIASLILPKVEGELAFILKKDLTGPGITIADVYNAVDFVAPAIEIVDSRITDWKIRLADTVADNGSSARLVVGSRVTPITDVDMRLTGMTLEKNGALISSGAVAEVWGNPAAAVAWLANELSRFGVGLKAGDIILSGAVTAAVPAQAGDHFTVSFQGMGSVTIRFV